MIVSCETIACCKVAVDTAAATWEWRLKLHDRACVRFDSRLLLIVFLLPVNLDGLCTRTYIRIVF